MSFTLRRPHNPNAVQGASSIQRVGLSARTWAAVVAALLLVVCLGCVRLKPGSDPIVVRTEQVQTLAGAAFDLIVETDDANRPFWRTNFPAFHSFAESLRVPVPVSGIEGRTTLPKYIAIQWRVDQAKLAYKGAKSASNSNLLTASLIAIEALKEQAEGWSSILTNKPPR